MNKTTICLWYDHDAEEAARFYAQTFPDSKITAVHKAPSDYPSGKAGDVLTVEFTVCGVPCLGLNGGDAFKHSEAFSFQIATDDQAETDRYWNAIVGHGGAGDDGDAEDRRRQNRGSGARRGLRPELFAYPFSASRNPSPSDRQGITKRSRPGQTQAGSRLRPTFSFTRSRACLRPHAVARSSSAYCCSCLHL